MSAATVTRDALAQPYAPLAATDAAPGLALGFSGSSRGMSAAQISTVATLLHDLRPAVVHHGDCVGADATVHAMAFAVNARRFVHPPLDARLRAYCTLLPGDECAPPRAYLERDDDLAAAGDLLVAAPYHDAEQRRSGTWATVRSARRRRKLVVVVRRDGLVCVERPA